MQVADYLAIGEKNARTGSELCRLLGIDKRKLTIAIEKERRAGTPICASCSGTPGYYLAGDSETMKRYCKSLDRRMSEIAKTKQACLRAGDKLPKSENS